MPVYVSKAGGVGLANVLTVEDLDSSWITGALSVDTSSFIVGASFGNPFVTFSFGDGTESYINLQTLVPTNASTASFVTASNVWGPYGANSVISASIAVSSSFATTSSFTLSSSFARTASFTLSSSVAATASYINLLAGPNITINYQPNGIAITGSGGGGGTPAPPEGGIQFNSASAFAASASFIFDYNFQSLEHGTGVVATGLYSYAHGLNNLATGIASHAEGLNVTASNNYAHAEGVGTLAAAAGSHTEGNFTTASGEYSHAEGVNTQTVGLGSHTEGYRTKTQGAYSHAEGYLTSGSGIYTHAEGHRTLALSTGSHAEGYYTFTSYDYDHSEGDTSATGLWGYFTKVTVVNGLVTITNLDLTSVFTPNTIVLIYESSSNVAYIHNVSSSTFSSPDTSIQLVDIGYSSAVLPEIYVLDNNKPLNSTPQAVFTGYDVFGQRGTKIFSKHSEGWNTIALGSAGHSEGIDTLAFGPTSHAEGYSTRAYALKSHTEGIQTYTGMFGYLGDVQDDTITLLSSYDDVTAIFDSNPSIILFDSSSNQFELLQCSSTVFDSSNTKLALSTEPTIKGSLITLVAGVHLPNRADKLVRLEGGHAEGQLTIALGSGSHAEGYNTFAVGEQSHAEGGLLVEEGEPTINRYTIAYGNYSHAEGASTQAIGPYSHAEGKQAQAIGSASHAEGDTTVSIGPFSHAEGSSTQAIGTSSHAEGSATQAKGTSAHAEGNTTIASGSFSHAEGVGTIAFKDYQLAIGQFNRDLNNVDLFVIGNGSSLFSRSDILNVSTTSVRITGSAFISSSLTVRGTNTTSGSVFVTGGINLVGNQTITGSLFVGGNITAQQYIISSSVIYVTESNFSGSHVFGNTLDDTHQFTGSVLVTGSATFIGPLNANSVFLTGSLFGTSSWSIQALTASFVTSSNVYGPFNANSILSASHGVTASYIDGGTF